MNHPVKHQQEYPEDEMVTVPVSEVMQRRFSLGPTIKVHKSRCPHCSDTGMATFYYLPADKLQVWTFPEWMALIQEDKDMLRCALAVCDCDKGMWRKERKRSPEMAMPVLEHIKKLSRSKGIMQGDLL